MKKPVSTNHHSKIIFLNEFIKTCHLSLHLLLYLLFVQQLLLLQKLQSILQPKKFPWLFKPVQRSKSIKTLMADLQNGIAVAACDRSFFPDDNITTESWIIESQSSNQFISGMSVPFLSSLYNEAYCAELTGILAIIHMATYLTLSHKLDNPSLTILYDNIKALERSF